MRLTFLSDLHQVDGEVDFFVSIPLRCTDLYYARGDQGVLPIRVGGATSQLDLPSLTPLSVAGCG